MIVHGITLKPGDALLYRGKGFVSWFIRVKTWSPVNHVEVYVGEGAVITARGNGSRVFPFTEEGLVEVWRPLHPLDLPAAMRWFYAAANGQKYDKWGLFRFFTLGRQSTDKQFCSELATRFYRAAGFDPFTKETDADLVSPGMFRNTPLMEKVKRDG
jgi:hypothetical protein